MDPGPPINLGSHTRGLRPRGTGPAYLVSRLISSYFGYFLVMGVLALLVPEIGKAFDDKTIQLQTPAATLLLIRVGRACKEHWVRAVILPLPVPAIWAVANFNMANRTRRSRIRLGAFIVVAAFLLFTLLALFLPMTHLLDAHPTTSATQ